MCVLESRDATCFSSFEVSDQVRIEIRVVISTGSCEISHAFPVA
jgi:hypothetical protein